MELLKDIEKKLPDPYKLIIFALIVTALLNASAFGYVSVILSGIFAIAIAQIFDVALTYIKAKKVIFGDSATIAALILVNIIAPGQFLLIGVTAALAMILKHIVRFEKKPVFNPAALSMFIAVILFSATKILPNPEQFLLGWGNSSLTDVIGTIALVVLGLLVTIKIRRFTASITYLLVYTITTFLMAGVAGLQYFPFFGAFFMVSEPRTSPSKTSHQIIFGIAAWVLGIIYVMLSIPVFYAFSLGFLSANVLKIGLEKSKI